MATPGVGMGQMVSMAGSKVASADKGLLRRAWSTKITLESLQYDSYMNYPALTGEIKAANDGKFTSMPGNIIQKVTAEGSKGARSVTMQYTLALSGTVYEGMGVDDAMGHEEDVAMLYCNAYSGDWGKGVTGQNYGVAFREKNPLKIFQLSKPLLAQYVGELMGKYKREALCQSVSHNIVAAGIGIDQMTNFNTYVVGNAVPFTKMSSYTSYSLYIAAVIAKVGNIDAGDVLTVKTFIALASAAKKANIRPVKWEGRELYILNINDDEFMSQFDPTNTGGIAKYWVEAAALGSGKLNEVIPAANFVIANSIVICSDLRAPQCKVDSGDLAFSYMLPGRNDQREVLTGEFYNVGILLGEDALFELETEAPHYEQQSDVYNKYTNTAQWGATGFQTPLWMNDDVTFATGHSTPITNATKTRQESSMLVIFAANGATYT